MNARDLHPGQVLRHRSDGHHYVVRERNHPYDNGWIFDRHDGEIRRYTPDLAIADEWETPPATRRRTGVIVGVDATTTSDGAAQIAETIADRFPGLDFAVVRGGRSVAFEWDGPA